MDNGHQDQNLKMLKKWFQLYIYQIYQKKKLNKFQVKTLCSWNIIRARILMTCHLSFLARQIMQFNVLISDIERYLQKQSFYSAFFFVILCFLSFVIFVILASFSCHICKVYFTFKYFFQVLQIFSSYLFSFLK